jgi:hypothetical protein
MVVDSWDNGGKMMVRMVVLEERLIDTINTQTTFFRTKQSASLLGIL